MRTPGWGGLKGIQENQIQSMPEGQPGECGQDTQTDTHTDLVAGCSLTQGHSGHRKMGKAS